ncbi:MAG: hypothetical protein ACC612_08450 [Methanomethylovorans sp.]|uniref:hypothetical protein n=1 Tax=Methanomethylovorans sp. TaxID=2758717 RepID=UPI0035310CEF
MSAILVKSCTNCKGALKKQRIGLNILYYCPKCGTITTANEYEYSVSKYGYTRQKQSLWIL